MTNDHYYPRTNDGRGAWWQNIADSAQPALSSIHFPTAPITDIINDASWGVYLYRTVRGLFDGLEKALTEYADTILDAPSGSPVPAQPTVPAYPADPGTAIVCGIESRRAAWVQAVKHHPGYTPAVGAILRIETPDDPFDYNSYQAELYALSAVNPHTVGGKFRKASGHVEAMNVYRRKSGTTAWALLGTFVSTPFSAAVPVAGSAPETWEFQGRAVRKNAEFGLPSDIVEAVIRP